MISVFPWRSLNSLVYRTQWGEFTINTTFHRETHVFSTSLYCPSERYPLAWYHTRDWDVMILQHTRALHLCWELIALVNEESEF